MSENYLSQTEEEVLQKEIVAYIEKFKKQLSQAADDVMEHLYCDVIPFATTDMGMNLRIRMMDALKGYPAEIVKNCSDWRAVRKKILEENRKAIINDLNQDNLKEIAELKEHITWLQKSLEYRQ
jgi:5-methylthioribose kinase